MSFGLGRGSGGVCGDGPGWLAATGRFGATTFSGRLPEGFARVAGAEGTSMISSLGSAAGFGGVTDGADGLSIVAGGCVRTFP